ncbi:Hypothetical_protein [Hexamita inflata]|uniref:Hypothetical_protein n=1 Tax=Hexamita inflata TaxID=28002 RepID=A0AA86QTJ6_9EUKA|nr:Hypothetical protein HINF_LOCUS46659 [Hexamita inflata]
MFTMSLLYKQSFLRVVSFSKPNVFSNLFPAISLIYQAFQFIYRLYVIIRQVKCFKTNDCATFESKTQALARQCFHFQNGLNPSFMPTQQRPNRALTELLANQFYLIRQLTFQKLVLASQFLFARYFEMCALNDFVRKSVIQTNLLSSQFFQYLSFLISFAYKTQSIYNFI